MALDTLTEKWYDSKKGVMFASGSLAGFNRLIGERQKAGYDRKED